MRSATPTAFVLLLVLAGGAARAQISCLTDESCSDGDFCDGVERCVAGTCVSGAPLECDDGDPCTSDSCVAAAGCVHTDDLCPSTCGPGDDGMRCSDHSACTTGDVCSAGVCLGTPVDCNDGDPCTTDSCDPVLGCTYVEEADPPGCVTSSECILAADHTPCVGDGDPCTRDGCLEGACRVGLIQAERQCDDGDACNGPEFCSPVKGCQHDNPLRCDDGNACNGVETCAPASGCVAGTPEPDGTPCDDGHACTASDACAAGVCSGTPLDCDDADAATTDVCVEPTGCLHCAPLDEARLTVRFPAGRNVGRVTTAGRFVPTSPFDPTAPAGADLLIHDGPTVLQSAHVDPAAFRSSAGGSVALFVDRTGTLAAGLERLRIKRGTPGPRYQFSAAAIPPATSVSLPARSLTLRAGSACATAALTCRASAGGKTDRCQ